MDLTDASVALELPVPDAVLAQIPVTCLGMISRVASRAATRVFAAHLAGLDLQTNQFAILVVVRLYGGEGVAALADHLDLNASALTRNLQVLERKGYVAAEGGRGRSGKRLALTEVGEAVLTQAWRRWRQSQAALITELGEADTDLLRGVLHRFESAAGRAEQRARSGLKGS